MLRRAVGARCLPPVSHSARQRSRVKPNRIDTEKRREEKKEEKRRTLLCTALHAAYRPTNTRSHFTPFRDRIDAQVTHTSGHQPTRTGYPHTIHHPTHHHSVAVTMTTPKRSGITANMRTKMENEEKQVRKYTFTQVCLLLLFVVSCSCLIVLLSSPPVCLPPLQPVGCQFAAQLAAG